MGIAAASQSRGRMCSNGRRQRMALLWKMEGPGHMEAHRCTRPAGSKALPHFSRTVQRAPNR
eukprot:14768958-Alexandrium_andersonii.AAC.1